ncbi:MAG: mechanosensitive ion channel domain-containing protein [Thermodesulforhabdaceae bacterium]
MKKLILISVVISIFLGGFTSIVLSEQETSTSPALDPEQLDKLSQSLTQAIQEEKIALDSIANRMAEFKRIQNIFVVELDSLNLLLSTYVNIANLSSIGLDDLEKVSSNLKGSLARISERMKEIEEKEEELSELINKTVEQRNVNEQQLKDLKARELSTPAAQTVIKSLGQLTELLKKKEKEFRKLHASYRALIDQAKTSINNGSVLLEKVDEHITKKKREELFQRKQSIFTMLSRESFVQELTQFWTAVTNLASKQFWISQWQVLARTTFVFVVVFLALLVGVEHVLKRISGFLSRTWFLDRVSKLKPFLFAHIQLILSSIGLLGAVVFAQIYFRINGLYDASTPVRFFVLAITVWLFTRWILDFLKIYKEVVGILRDKVFQTYLKVYVHIARWLILLYLFIKEFVGFGSFFISYRLAMELAFLGMLGFFWKECRSILLPILESKKAKIIFFGLVSFSYLVFGGSVLMELLGYTLFVSLWLASWAYTFVFSLWVWMIAQDLIEWERTLKGVVSYLPEDSREYQESLSWLLLRLFWVAFVLGSIIVLLIVWGAKREVLLTTIKLLHTPIPIGNMSFRLISLVYATIIITVTRLVTRKIRHFMKEGLFKYSGLDHGVQESIITITTYIAWLLGIMLALNVIGFSSTSFTVLFGALGVGLGFGLQQIFNNFVSGVIMLIERPIQVGDVVEIGGIRGVVKKVNVRATVVQTFDNASFIIPNSEFISGRIINWSFQDPTIRNSITVGVAYGSDINLVKDTLMEAAINHPKVIKDPPPDVLFKDFGDSALVFSLRFFTHAKDAILTETELRSAIYKLFVERGIEIPFPQRDVHIKSGVIQYQGIESS